MWAATLSRAWIRASLKVALIATKGSIACIIAPTHGLKSKCVSVVCCMPTCMKGHFWSKDPVAQLARFQPNTWIWALPPISLSRHSNKCTNDHLRGFLKLNPMQHVERFTFHVHMSMMCSILPHQHHINFVCSHACVPPALWPYTLKTIAQLDCKQCHGRDTHLLSSRKELLVVGCVVVFHSILGTFVNSTVLLRIIADLEMGHSVCLRRLDQKLFGWILLLLVFLFLFGVSPKLNLMYRYRGNALCANLEMFGSSP